MIPLKDEVVPRKPLIKLLKDERIKNSFADKIRILVYKDSYHMILRDLNGDQITEDLKNWVIGKEYDLSNSSFSDILKQIENTKVDKLSKGEKQKVVIARALINKPEIIIADQPENFLDKSTVKKVFFLFESLNKQGTTIIITSNLEKIISVNYKTINLD